MKCDLRSRHALVAGTVIMLTCMSGTALAITESSYNYTAPKTGYYGISNLAMAPQSSENTDYFNPGDTGGLITGTMRQCFNTAVNLPNGAVITELVVYFRGADEDDVSVQLIRQRLSTGGEQKIANKSFTDFSTDRVSDTAPINANMATVNNAQYNYGFRVCVDPGGTFHGARITYTYTNAGD